MLSFLAGSFAVAGLAAAAGPLIIHLLNRRRYKVVPWGAMDFLRESIRRSRRILHLRDLLLLILRTACVLLFGLAMARPYFASNAQSASPDQPVHAIVLVDNSLSMSYQRLKGTLFDEARGKAKEFLAQLPPGSRMSILPMCGSEGQFSLDPFRTQEDALEALDALTLVDRVAALPGVLDLAQQAASRAPELPTKRIVLIGDQQGINWPSSLAEETFRQLPDVQLVQVLAERAENAWIADFRVQDGLADVETTTQFVVTVRFEGFEPRLNVPVSLTVDGVAAATQVVDLEPGQTREVVFPYRFDVAVEPGRAVYVPAQVELPPDRLPGDNLRTLVVPVVAAMPVVFVDEQGPDETPAKNLYGETYPWRRLLAPITTRADAGRQLITVRHVKLDDLSRELLQDVRLVIVAGVEQPGGAVDVLREFVEQGGRLVVAAGGRFDPAAWNAQAFRNGRGLLPLPLTGESIGRTPEEPGSLQPFQLEARGLVHDYFVIESTSDEERADLYQSPSVLFFKGVRIDDRPATIEQLVTADQAERQARAEAPRQREEAKRRGTGDAAATAIESPSAPAWLVWTEGLAASTGLPESTGDSERGRPRVLARFTNGAAYLVERDVERGRLLFVASGVRQDWNTLMSTHAALLFDRVFRSYIQDTLPERNVPTGSTLAWPVAPRERSLRFALVRPDGQEEPLWVDALGGDQFALVIRRLDQRGLYRVVGHRPDGATSESVWDVLLSAHGEPRESELKSLTTEAFDERYAGSPWRWVGREQPVSLAGAAVFGQDAWRWLMLAMLIALLVELLTLAWTQRATSASPAGGRA